MSELEKSLKQEKSVDTMYVKCVNCGGNMIFDPASQELKCVHCGSLSDFAKNKEVKELAIEDAFRQAEKWDDEASVYRCDNCGAVVVLNIGETATNCPYCETSHVVKQSGLVGLKPNAIYPFTIIASAAVEKAKAWAKKRLFAPRKFKNSLNEQSLKGVYEPSFTFDSCTHSQYHGRLGKRYTRVVGSGKNRRTETYIKYFNVSGYYSYNFDDVFINASKSYGQKELDKMMPFDYSTIKVYEQKFLTGFMAHRHEKNINDAWKDAKDTMDSKLRSLILNQYTYDVVDYLNVSTTHENVNYKYVLLPVYHLRFPYKKKTYGMLVNGNTGKVTGKTPISPLKVGIAVLLGLAIIGLLVLLYYLNT